MFVGRMSHMMRSLSPDTEKASVAYAIYEMMSDACNVGAVSRKRLDEIFEDSPANLLGINVDVGKPITSSDRQGA
jgi:hypothetical protein